MADNSTPHIIPLQSPTSSPSHYNTGELMIFWGVEELMEYFERVVTKSDSERDRRVILKANKLKREAKRKEDERKEAKRKEDERKEDERKEDESDN